MDDIVFRHGRGKISDSPMLGDRSYDFQAQTVDRGVKVAKRVK